MSDLLWLIPGLPLLAAVMTALLGPALLRKQSHWPAIVATALSCLLSFAVLREVRGTGPVAPRLYSTWFAAGTVDIGFTLQADYLTAVMLVTITFVGTLIAIFSVGYMSHEREHEEGYARFFAEIALFIFAMTGLVLANNFILLYAFWEGVGLCSYLLIGFWFAKPSAAAAARKAFLVTRLGDIGFFIGILLLWKHFGYSLDFDHVFEPASLQRVEPLWLLAASLLLFCGAVGKSAQFPLHVWLPDAMEGPTPVSALIHAATMVTAGVYLVARCTPLFVLAPEAQLVVACIGGITALLAALIALTQNDLKRVMAYSTLSQLGYMFLALGSGVGDLKQLAVVAAIFHLFTHAFFKALLFLSSGSVMHALGNVIDMRRFSGLRHVLPVTHWTFLCGALALAGIPPLAGFWSKDEILAAAFGASRQPDNPYAPVYAVLLILGLVTTGLTAFYTFRAYFLTFWGELNVPPEAGHHAHESPPVMLWPLRILAVGAVALGLLYGPTHWFAGFLGRSDWLQVTQEHHLNVVLMLLSSLLSIGGGAVAWWMYFLKPGAADKLVERIQPLYQISLNKFFFDEIYARLVVFPVLAFSVLCRVFDLRIVDGLVDLIGEVPSWFGQFLRPLQNGLTQWYALSMALGLVVFLIMLVARFSL